MIKEVRQVKISLNQEETVSLQRLSNIDCSHIDCAKCPLMLEDTNGKCLRTLTNEVLNNLCYEPRSLHLYTIVSE